MRRSKNLGLALYEESDLMRITDEQDSLNHNTEVIDDEITKLKSDSKAQEDDIAELESSRATREELREGLTNVDNKVGALDSRLSESITHIKNNTVLIDSDGYFYIEEEDENNE